MCDEVTSFLSLHRSPALWKTLSKTGNSFAETMVHIFTLTTQVFGGKNLLLRNFGVRYQLLDWNRQTKREYACPADPEFIRALYPAVLSLRAFGSCGIPNTHVQTHRCDPDPPVYIKAYRTVLYYPNCDNWPRGGAIISFRFQESSLNLLQQICHFDCAGNLRFQSQWIWYRWYLWEFLLNCQIWANIYFLPMAHDVVSAASKPHRSLYMWTLRDSHQISSTNDHLFL